MNNPEVEKLYNVISYMLNLPVTNSKKYDVFSWSYEETKHKFHILKTTT